jgi:hypothetical protein
LAPTQFASRPTWLRPTIIACLVLVILVLCLFVVCWITNRLELVVNPVASILQTTLLAVTVWLIDFDKKFTPTDVSLKASELSRLLQQAKRGDSETNESTEVWAELSFLSTKLYSHHQSFFTSEIITDLAEMLTKETAPKRLAVLVRLSQVAADPVLLPSLTSLRARANDIDPSHSLEDQIAIARTTCSSALPATS